MSARVYVLLDVMEDKPDQVVRVLQGKTGVKMVDVLEGSPNVIMLIQARDRQQLAELTIQAITSTETMTDPR
jgi:ACT domain-containing protein